jgi:ferredoxin-NADP reductase
MKQEVVRQLDGFDEIMKEIEVTRKFGSDYSTEKGTVEEIIRRLHPKKLNLRVSEILEETASAKTIRLVSSDSYLPPFQAGQYITLYLEIGKIRTSRPYSISSSPCQTAYYDITVRRVDRGLVSAFLLDRVKPGFECESSGPAGNFYYNPVIHDKTMVCLAGGSGITPIMSMVREIAEKGLDRDVILFYGNTSLKDVIFHEELSRISKNHKNIKYIPVIEKPSKKYTGSCGYITGSLIKKTLRNLDGKTFFVCGPKGMYDFCLPEVEALGIPRRKLRREMFGPPLGIWEYPGWPETVKKNAVFSVRVGGKKSATIKAAAAEPLLTAMEKAGIVVPSLCRSGECSQCRVKLVAGKVFMPPGVPMRSSDRQFGYIHSCVSYPLEDCEVLI